MVIEDQEGVEKCSPIMMVQLLSKLTLETRILLWGLQNIHKTSTFDKYVIKFIGTANLIPNFEFVEEYVKNNKQIKCFKFIFRTYQIPHLEFVSCTRFKFDEIAKPSKYLYYLEQYVSTAYLGTYLDFLVFTQSMAVSELVSGLTNELIIGSMSGRGGHIELI